MPRSKRLVDKLVTSTSPPFPSQSGLVESISKKDPPSDFNLPYYRPGMVHWSKVSTERLLSIAREFARAKGIRVKDGLTPEWSGLVFELKKRNLFKDLVLDEIPKEGIDLSDTTLRTKAYPFILRATLFDQRLASTPFPLSKKGYRQFRYVTDSHLYSVAVKKIRDNPKLINISAFVKDDSPFGEELIRRKLDQYINFERPGKSKRKFKRRPTKKIVAEIQQFTDANKISGPVDLRRYDTGLFRIYYARKLSGQIKFYEKPQEPKSKDLDEDELDSD